MIRTHCTALDYAEQMIRVPKASKASKASVGMDSDAWKNVNKYPQMPPF